MSPIPRVETHPTGGGWGFGWSPFGDLTREQEIYNSLQRSRQARANAGPVTPPAPKPLTQQQREIQHQNDGYLPTWRDDTRETEKYVTDWGEVKLQRWEEAWRTAADNPRSLASLKSEAQMVLSSLERDGVVQRLIKHCYLACGQQLSITPRTCEIGWRLDALRRELQNFIMDCNGAEQRAREAAQAARAEQQRAAEEAVRRLPPLPSARAVDRPAPRPTPEPPRPPSPPPVAAETSSVPPASPEVTEDAQALTSSEQPNHPELETAKQSLPAEALQDPCVNASCEAADLGMEIADQLRAEGNAEGATQLSDAVVSSIRDIGEAWGNTTTGSIATSLAEDMFITVTGKEPGTGDNVSGGRWAWSAIQWLPIGKVFGGFAKFAVAIGPVSQLSPRVARAARSILESMQAAAMELRTILPEGQNIPLKDVFEAVAEYGKKVLADLRAGTVGVGVSNITDHRAVFAAAFPEVNMTGITVHHAIEQQILNDYPGLFTRSELNSLLNLRGIPNEVNNTVHLSRIRILWNEFYEAFPPSRATRQDFFNFAKRVDDELGHMFNPPIRKAQ